MLKEVVNEIDQNQEIIDSNVKENIKTLISNPESLNKQAKATFQAADENNTEYLTYEDAFYIFKDLISKLGLKPPEDDETTFKNSTLSIQGLVDNTTNEIKLNQWPQYLKIQQQIIQEIAS